MLNKIIYENENEADGKIVISKTHIMRPVSRPYRIIMGCLNNYFRRHGHELSSVQCIKVLVIDDLCRSDIATSNFDIIELGLYNRMIFKAVYVVKYSDEYLNSITDKWSNIYHQCAFRHKKVQSLRYI